MLKKYLMFKMMGVPDQTALMYAMMGGGGSMNMMLMMMMMGQGQSGQTGTFGTLTGFPAVAGTALGTMLPLLLTMGSGGGRRRRYYRRRRGGGFMSGFVKGLSAGRA